MSKSNVKKPKSNGLVKVIHQLHACIAKDQKQLAKAYKQAINDADKKVVNVTKLLVKAKKSVQKAKNNKKDSPKDYQAMVSLYQSLKKELILLVEAQKSIKLAFKKAKLPVEAAKKPKAVKAKSAVKKKKAVKAKKAAVATVNDETPVVAE